MRAYNKINANVSQIQMGFLGDPAVLDNHAAVYIGEEALVFSFVTTAYGIKKKAAMENQKPSGFNRWPQGIIAHEEGRKVVNALLTNLRHLAQTTLTLHQLEGALREMVLSHIGELEGEMDGAHKQELRRFLDELLHISILLWVQRDFVLSK